jgi:hypothetical protein
MRLHDLSILMNDHPNHCVEFGRVRLRRPAAPPPSSPLLGDFFVGGPVGDALATALCRSRVQTSERHLGHLEKLFNPASVEVHK